MRYKYTATQSDGKIADGEMDAVDVPQVLQFIASRGLKPISVQKTGGFWQKLKHVQVFGGSITPIDQIFISKYLGLMLKIGTSLLQAINILLEDFKKPAVREFLVRVRTSLEQGQPFHLVFQNYPKVFSSVYVNLVKAGESSGNLDSTFENLSESLAKEKDLKDQVRGALVYPIILLGASFLILVFLITFALPRISQVFTDGGFDPPLFSRVVFSIGLLFGKIGWIVVVGFILAIILAFYFYRASILFKRFVIRTLSGLPMIRDVVRKIALQRFSATLSSLIRAGMPFTESLEITADAVGNTELKDALLRISREGISKGLTVGEAFKRETFFPQTVINLISVSERAGHIEEVLDALSDFYAKEVSSSLKTVVSFLEPVLLMFVGGIVGVIALSVIIPVYQLTSQF
ncbi:hypothetical protein CL629_01255 [bacterium]|nr:hypothetical protein [bacterium]